MVATVAARSERARRPAGLGPSVLGLPALACALVLLAGCGSSEQASGGPTQAEGPGAQPPPAVQAYWKALAASGAADGESAADPAPGPERVTEAEQVKVDGESQRVFLPGKGWLSAAQFWELYLHRPQELPAGLPHEKLRVLERPMPQGGGR